MTIPPEIPGFREMAIVPKSKVMSDARVRAAEGGHRSTLSDP
jgi:hypothetical protein